MKKNNKKANGYKIDFTNNIIIMNYKFAAAAKIVGTFEYHTYRSLMRDFPHMKTVVKSGRKQTKPRYNKRFTYDNMKTYITAACTNATEVLQQFETVKKQSKIIASPYKYVSDWFKLQFPDYKEIPDTPVVKKNVFVEQKPNTDNYKLKEEKAA